MSDSTGNIEPGAVKGEAIPGTRPRGRFWESTFKKHVPDFVSWCLEKDADLATETGKINVVVTAEEGTRAVNLSKKHFETCDFNHFTLEDSSFADCSFVDCRFVKSDFDTVKFSRCRFDTCHFLNVQFWKCRFIDCTFSNISASAEHLLFSESSISASAFIDALVTNTTALPEGKSTSYQEHRFLSTKVKIARAIFISVRDEPELDQLFDANRCFELALQRKKIDDAYWTTVDGQLVKRNRFFRSIVWPVRLAALGVIRSAGFLTNWGRSPLRSLWVLGSAVGGFFLIYHFAFGIDLQAAFLRALDCSFVFGYTRYAAGTPTGCLDWIMFVNAFVGFCWYALLIPALSKRLFR
jgi:uncharacterized protein YjbI with pentapeptide repeats